VSERQAKHKKELVRRRVKSERRYWRNAYKTRK
jgi:hypothetical protein